MSVKSEKTKKSMDLSGKRGSDPRPPAWEASALPTELLPQNGEKTDISIAAADNSDYVPWYLA